VNEAKIIELTRDELQWDMNHHSNGPCFRGIENWPLGTVDPFPCYGHSADLARTTLETVAAAFPINHDVVVYLAPFESVVRTNGETSRQFIYDYSPDRDPNAESDWAIQITLWGKRIPPMPAMTRYLVAHEYGHATAYHIAAELPIPRIGRNAPEPSEKLYPAYRELRGLNEATEHRSGGGTWHQATAEIFANDFRVLVAGVELEFWPHDCPRPEAVPGLAEWWAARCLEARRPAAVLS
jgi:hypothetical protein